MTAKTVPTFRNIIHMEFFRFSMLFTAKTAFWGTRICVILVIEMTNLRLHKFVDFGTCAHWTAKSTLVPQKCCFDSKKHTKTKELHVDNVSERLGQL